MVGTGLAVLGSLYLVVAKRLQAAVAEEPGGNTPVASEHAACTASLRSL